MKSKKFMKTFKTFSVFLMLGLVGIGFLVPSLIPMLEAQLKTIPNPPDLPFDILVVSSLITPLILLIIAILVGQLTAPKLKLVSYLYNHINEKHENGKLFKSNVPLGIISGVSVSIILFILELLFQPYLPQSLQLTLESRNLLNTLGGVFYGGVVEEILIRWGLMSLLIWILWKVFQRKKEEPTSGIFWISIMVTSFMFALGHLGATMLAAPLTPMILARMFLLNGIGGIVFGWLYWKKGLEIAMVSHATVHITTTIIMNIWFLV